MKLDKLKTFCGWMYNANVKYSEWTEKNKMKSLAIFAILLALIPKPIFLIFLLVFILFRMLHEDGNWWYEWSDIDELEGGEFEEGNNTTGC